MVKYFRRVQRKSRKALPALSLSFIVQWRFQKPYPQVEVVVTLSHCQKSVQKHIFIIFSCDWSGLLPFPVTSVTCSCSPSPLGLQLPLQPCEYKRLSVKFHPAVHSSSHECCFQRIKDQNVLIKHLIRHNKKYCQF